MTQIRTIYPNRPATTGRNQISTIVRRMGLKIGPKRPQMLRRIKYAPPVEPVPPTATLSMWLGMVSAAFVAWVAVS